MRLDDIATAARAQALGAAGLAFRQAGFEGVPKERRRRSVAHVLRMSPGVTRGRGTLA
jgi:hypothetical protein